jgi:hypothetical protein
MTTDETREIYQNKPLAQLPRVPGQENIIHGIYNLEIDVSEIVDSALTANSKRLP